MRTAGAGRMIERRVEGGTGRSGRFFSEAGGRELLVPPDRTDDAQSQDQTIDTHGDQ